MTRGSQPAIRASFLSPHRVDHCRHDRRLERVRCRDERRRADATDDGPRAIGKQRTGGLIRQRAGNTPSRVLGMVSVAAPLAQVATAPFPTDRPTALS